MLDCVQTVLECVIITFNKKDTVKMTRNDNIKTFFKKIAFCAKTITSTKIYVLNKIVEHLLSFQIVLQRFLSEMVTTITNNVAARACIPALHAA